MKLKVFSIQSSSSCPKSKSLLHKLNGNRKRTKRATMCPLKAYYVPGIVLGFPSSFYQAQRG